MQVLEPAVDPAEGGFTEKPVAAHLSGFGAGSLQKQHLLCNILTHC